ncbi:MAG: lipopolysaccharide biosynthesis protein RfbH [Dehalococcoidia bacterium]|nr:MAG: lipopolysaccharide biosynthesis protein RfbH [Dehalococcoidia bacterium]
MPDPAGDAGERRQILDLVEAWGARQGAAKPFEPGKTYIPVSGKVVGGLELRFAADAVLDGWLTTGRFAIDFERAFARSVGLRHAMFVNSGSSANLLAISALTSPALEGRRLQRGDEVITAAAGFPTTLNGILQNGLVPVLVDVDPSTGNVDPEGLRGALSDKTRAIFMAHTLGNPFDLDAVMEIVRERNLWLIEDNCDALGAKWDGKHTGTYGDLMTCSFYPAHHITTGEGGMVGTQDPLLKKLVESFRDWGRDCWCEPGDDNTCGLRFDSQYGDLPHGYDHKYVYSHIGYNLKGTDFQAAIGLAQIESLDAFVAARRANFAALYEGLTPLAHKIDLPRWLPKAEPSWFGFPIVVKPDAGFTRDELVRHLEGQGIGTRPMFAGNFRRHPAYQEAALRVAGSLTGADTLTERGFWIGTWPGITREMLDYMVSTFEAFARK